MKRKIPAMVLVTALALMLLPTVARADINRAVSTEDEFKLAVADSDDGDTIELTDDIGLNVNTADPAITVSNKSITIKVGDHTLSIVNDGGVALQVGEGGVVKLEKNSGTFSVTGTTYGVEAIAGGQATVTKATATGEQGKGACADGTDSRVEVNGNAQGKLSGAYASDGGSVEVGGEALGAWAGARVEGSGNVTVSGNAEATGPGGHGVHVSGTGSTVTVDGDAKGVSIGAFASGTGNRVSVGGSAQGETVGAYGNGPGCVIEVGGSATATSGASLGMGVCVGEGGTIIVDGNVQGVKTGICAAAGGSATANSAEATGVDGIGAWAEFDGTITVNGTITGDVYIRIDGKDKVESDGVTGSGGDAGHQVYADMDSPGSKVRVKMLEEPLVCEIVSTSVQYTNLSDALDEAEHDDTMRLLTSIHHTGGISISAKSITLDVGSYTLSIFNMDGAALQVGQGGIVKLEKTTGALKAIGTTYGVEAMAGGRAAATKATATGERGKGAYAWGGSIVEADSATATGTLSYGAYAVGAGSRVEVAGEAQGTWAGARAEDGGSIKTGSVMATGPGSHGASTGGTDSSVTVVGNAQGVTCGAYASGTDSSVMVGGNVLGENIGAWASGSGCTIKVDGDVTATSGARTGLGVNAEEGGTIIVGGHVQGVNIGISAARGGSATACSAGATGENGTGAWAELRGTVTVSGDIQATGAGSVGAAAVGTGSLVTVEGAIMAEDTYIMIGRKDTGVKKSPYPTDGSFGVGANLGYLVYDDAKHDGMVRVKVKITGLPASWTMLTGGQVTWNPQPGGGIWHWDPDFFSASFNSPATFTAKKEGRSAITYTAGGVTQSIDVTVQASVSSGTGQDDLPEEVVPATGQYVTPGILLLMLAACMGTAAAAVVRGRRRKVHDDAE